MPTYRAWIVAAFVAFGLATVWPALPPSAQGLKINLVALGLALVTLALYLHVSG